MSESLKHINPVDYFNFRYPFKDIFKNLDQATQLSPTEFSFPNAADLSDKTATFKLQENNLVAILKDNSFRLTKGDIISKFMVFTAVRFKGDYTSAMSYVLYKIMDLAVPYIRVGTDYYKSIEKDNRYGGTDRTLKTWGKETISEDHGKNIFTLLPKYDDFTIIPDNITYSPVHKNCYNLYAPFPHVPAPQPITAADIPHSLGVVRHIFGEQYDLGLKYLKVLYEHPKQMLPILSLVSEERVTGKTTLMNWVQMIFGDNSISINPEAITSQFNATYATKNIILIDETVMEKSTGVEKLKSLATAKTITVNQKHVQGYTIPFFAKIIICTNKERDFMRIDKAEVRFWIRKINTITGTKNIAIEEDLFREIPAFLKYLKQLPAIDFTKSRMVFTQEEIATQHLKEVKEESKSWLHKEIDILIDDYFDNNPDKPHFLATATDIKKKWFEREHSASRAYISKVINQEMKLKTEKPQHYWPFDEPNGLNKAIGRPFKFVRIKERIGPIQPKLALEDPDLNEL